MQLEIRPYTSYVDRSLGFNKTVDFMQATVDGCRIISCISRCARHKAPRNGDNPCNKLGAKGGPTSLASYTPLKPCAR